MTIQKVKEQIKKIIGMDNAVIKPLVSLMSDSKLSSSKMEETKETIFTRNEMVQETNELIDTLIEKYQNGDNALILELADLAKELNGDSTPLVAVPIGVKRIPFEKVPFIYREGPDESLPPITSIESIIDLGEDDVDKYISGYSMDRPGDLYSKKIKLADLVGVSALAYLIEKPE